MEKERITKLVLTLDSIGSSRGWSLAQKDKSLLCYSCKSPLFYIEVVWGIVDETWLFRDVKVLGKEREPQYYLREVGFNLHCAECGKFEESYSKYFYPEDKIVCSWNDEGLDLAEIEEIKHCIEQFNRKGDFIPNYNSSEMRYLKEKLTEYEKNLPKSKDKSRKNNPLPKKFRKNQ